MTFPPSLRAAPVFVLLLQDYSFEPGGGVLETVVARWLADYEPLWVGYAITEALYQGRYKLVSVEQILRLWQRRGQPRWHFSREFETMVLGSATWVLTEPDPPPRPEPAEPAPGTSPDVVASVPLVVSLDAPPPISPFVPHVDWPSPAHQRLQAVASRRPRLGDGG